MWIKKIKFDHNEIYLGRNGVGKCCGVEIVQHSSFTELWPINSKGDAAQCRIEIPNESLDEVCLTLSPVFSLVLDRLAKAGQLPLLLGLGNKALNIELEKRLKG